MVPISLPQFAGFQWDKGNQGKNWTRHKVSDEECEEVFFNLPVVVAPDPAHSERENRHYLLGRTNDGRRLFVVFTPRGDKVRVISARDMTRKERRAYHEAEKASA